MPHHTRSGSDAGSTTPTCLPGDPKMQVTVQPPRLGDSPQASTLHPPLRDRNWFQQRHFQKQKTLQSALQGRHWQYWPPLQSHPRKLLGARPQSELQPSEVTKAARSRRQQNFRRLKSQHEKIQATDRPERPGDFNRQKSWRSARHPRSRSTSDG